MLPKKADTLAFPRAINADDDSDWVTPRRSTASYVFDVTGPLRPPFADFSVSFDGEPMGPPRASTVRLRAPTEAELEASHASTLPPLSDDGFFTKWRRTVDPGPLVAAHLLHRHEKRILDALEIGRNADEVAQRVGLPISEVECALAFLFARGLVQC